MDRPAGDVVKEVRSASVFPARRRFVYLVIVWVLGLALSVAGVWSAGRTMLSDRGLREVPFHPDESYRISMAPVFDLFVLQRDWHNEYWFDDFVGPDHPHLGHYVQGWALWRAGLPRDAVLTYDFDQDYEANLGEGRVPDEDTLLACRRVTAALGVGTVAGMALICILAGRPVSGGIAAWLAGHCGLFRTCTIRAMQESPQLFFMTCSVVLIVLGFRLLSGRGVARAAGGGFVFVLGGVSAGLAAATKMNALILLPFAAVVASLLLWQGQVGSAGRRVVRAGLSAAVFLLVALGTLKYSNPYFFSYPAGAPEQKHGLFAGMGRMFAHQTDMAAKHRERYFEFAVQPTLGAKAHIVLARTLGPNHTYYPPGHANLRELTGLQVDGVAALAGGLVLAWACAGEYRLRRRVSPLVVLLGWVITVYAGTIWWMPLDWARYFLPALTYVQLLIAAGLAAPLEWWLARSSKPALAEVTCGR